MERWGRRVFVYFRTEHELKAVRKINFPCIWRSYVEDSYFLLLLTLLYLNYGDLWNLCGWAYDAVMDDSL